MWIALEIGNRRWEWKLRNPFRKRVPPPVDRGPPLFMAGDEVHDGVIWRTSPAETPLGRVFERLTEAERALTVSTLTQKPEG